MPNDHEKNDTHEDLDRDIEMPGDEYVNMEGENRSTAAEGNLISVEADKNQEQNLPNASKVDSPAPPDETKKTTLKEDETVDKDEVSS